MKITIALDKYDWSAFISHVQIRLRNVKGSPIPGTYKSYLRDMKNIIFIALFTLIIMVLFRFSGVSISFSVADLSVVFTVFFIMIGVFVACFYYYYQKFSTKSQPLEDGIFYMPYVLELTDMGIDRSSDEYSIHISWNCIKSIERTENHFLSFFRYF